MFPIPRNPPKDTTAIAAHRSDGLDLGDQVIAHLSPARYEHINPYGTYNFDVQAILERPKPRPLRPTSLR